MANEKCPHCKFKLGAKDAEYFAENGFYTCPECERSGCDDCMPGGRGCLCPECENGGDD